MTFSLRTDESVVGFALGFDDISFLCCFEAMACVGKYSEIFGGEAMSARGRQLLAVLQLRGLGDRPRISAGRSEARGSSRGSRRRRSLRADFAPDILSVG